MPPLKRLLVCLSAAALLSACTGLGGEPQIVATRALPTPDSAPQAQTVADVGYPQNPPNLTNGARIFAARCAECHGGDGAGNGALVQSGQVPAITSFLDTATMRDQTPQDWFDTITDGRLDKLMPPWKDALTEQERWDVAFYTYTMHATPARIEQGRTLYEAECAECHGTSGKGDGAEAAQLSSPPPDLTRAREMSSISDGALYTLIAEGSPDVMPAFADSFTPEQFDAVIAYTRMLAVAGGAESVAQARESVTPEATAQTVKVMDIAGTVYNRTPNASVPDGLSVTLRAFDPVTFTPLDDASLTVPLDADNAYRFEAVEVYADRFYLASVNHQGRDFASGFTQPDFTQDTLTLDIDLFEMTDDPAVIEIKTGVIQIRVIGDSIEFQQFWQFRNTSNSVYSSLTAGADGRYSALEMSLPPGALVLGFDDERSYTISDDGSTVYDMRAMLPAEERLTLVSYLVQYGGGAVIEFPTRYAINGEMRLIVQPDTIKITSTQFPYIGTDDVGGENFEAYGGRLNLAGGEMLRFELSGQAMTAAQVGQQTSTTISSDALLPTLLIAGVVGLAIAVIVIVLVARRRKPTADSIDDLKDADKHIDTLVAQIGELDRQHDAGEINHDLYQQQRAALRQRLAILLAAKGDVTHDA